jgi:hypothetical protein
LKNKKLEEVNYWDLLLWIHKSIEI